jgi:hypothetical protein
MLLPMMEVRKTMRRRTKLVSPTTTAEAKGRYRRRSGDSLTVSVPPNGNIKPALGLDDRLLQRYHLLVDKQLNGPLSKLDEHELQRIEQQIQLFEDAETSEMEKAIERRHRTMMQQLSELTEELRKFSSGGPQSNTQ